MTNKTELVSVPRELLQDLIDSAQLEVDERLRAYGEDYRPHVLAAQRKVVADACAILAAPADDVRSVVDEPVDNEQTVYLIVFDDYDVRPETVIGEAAARQRYTQLSNNWNAHLFVKLESNSRDDPHARSNYRHPQRPVVMPKPEVFERLVIDHYGFGSSQLCLLSGKDLKTMFDACLKEFARLNPEISK